MLDSMEIALKLMNEPSLDLDPYLIVGSDNYYY